MKTRLKFSTLIAAVVVPLTALGQSSQTDQFGLSARYIRLGSSSRKMTLSGALRDAAARTRQDYLTFGVEFASDEIVEPMVDAGSTAGTSFRAFLDGIVRQVPQYEYDAISPHFISIHPRGAKDDAGDVLNIRISRFDINQTFAGAVLGYPVQFIRELRERLYPQTPGQTAQTFLYMGPVIQGPEVTVHLTDVTVRDALNAISIATEGTAGDEDYPVGWTYRSAAESKADHPRFGGLLTLPPDWRETLHPKAPKKAANSPSPGN